MLHPDDINQEGRSYVHVSLGKHTVGLVSASSPMTVTAVPIGRALSVTSRPKTCKPETASKALPMVDPFGSVQTCPENTE